MKYITSIFLTLLTTLSLSAQANEWNSRHAFEVVATEKDYYEAAYIWETNPAKGMTNALTVWDLRYTSKEIEATDTTNTAWQVLVGIDPVNSSVVKGGLYVGLAGAENEAMDEKSGAFVVGGKVTFTFIKNLDVKLNGYYAPDFFSWGEGRYHYLGNASLDYRLTNHFSVEAGYKNHGFKTDSGKTKLHDGAFIGLKVKF